MPTRIVFRTDASTAIGSGHLMRCLSLADELRARGAEITFICKSQPGDLRQLFETKGYPVTWLAGDADENDAVSTAAVVSKIRPEWLIIDHYGLDRCFEEQVRGKVGRLMVIDDLADRPHNCDLLLDQNLYHDMESRYTGLLPDDCQTLLGPRYALLRHQFGAARKSLAPRDGAVRRVLVCFGGADPSGETLKAIDALAGLHLPLSVDVVFGAANPHRDRIEAACSANDFTPHHQVHLMALLMAQADLMIGGGGSTTWERCALGLPALVVTVAENQVPVARQAAETGLIFYLGMHTTVGVENLRSAIEMFCSLPEALRCQSKAGLSAVDGKGAQRVAGLLMPPDLTVRPARAEDCDNIYHWRNAEETRRYIFDKTVIPLDDHRSWFARTLANPDRELLIGEMDGRPVGVLRYDICKDQALVSVYLVPGGQGKGVGSELIRSGSRWLKDNYPTVSAVTAEIMSENGASVRAFELAGYKKHHLIYKEVL